MNGMMTKVLFSGLFEIFPIQPLSEDDPVGARKHAQDDRENDAKEVAYPPSDHSQDRRNDHDKNKAHHIERIMEIIRQMPKNARFPLCHR